MGQIEFYSQEHKEVIYEVFMKDALYTYFFDVTTGIINGDIIDKNGFNYTKAVNLTAPYSFDEIMKRTFDKDIFGVEYILESAHKNLSCKFFLDMFESGKTHMETTVYIPNWNMYNRLTYILMRDYKTGHVIAYVICHDTTELETVKLRETMSSQRKLVENDKIVARAGIGIWNITYFENQKPAFSRTDKMMDLIGLENSDITDEEVYDFWYTRIKPSSLPTVQNSIEEMIKNGFPENTYIWNHPEKGETYVRCGGISRYIDGKGYILQGYHCDVTDIVNSDIKYKQLLADALDEAKNRKSFFSRRLTVISRQTMTEELIFLPDYAIVRICLSSFRTLFPENVKISAECS